MIHVAITRMAAIRHVKDVSDDAERTAFTLHFRIKRQTLIVSGRIHIHWPARINRSGIQIERKDQMFLGRAAVGRCHGIQEESAGR
jgi:hypothetical protein